jgi:hypothetical protein
LNSLHGGNPLSGCTSRLSGFGRPCTVNNSQWAMIQYGIPLMPPPTSDAMLPASPAPVHRVALSYICYIVSPKLPQFSALYSISFPSGFLVPSGLCQFPPANTSPHYPIVLVASSAQSALRCNKVVSDEFTGVCKSPAAGVHSTVGLPCTFHDRFFELAECGII